MSNTERADGQAVTQLAAAKQGEITAAMKRVAEKEQIDAALVRDEVAAGRMVIPANKVHLAHQLEDRVQGIRDRAEPARGADLDELDAALQQIRTTLTEFEAIGRRVLDPDGAAHSAAAATSVSQAVR